jgi:Uma2 family endonuclease
MPYMTGHDETRPTSATKLTCDDFLGFPGFEDDGQRHELIDGEHVVAPSPTTVHQRLVAELHLALVDVVHASGVGEVFLGPYDVVLSNHDVLEPDLLVVLADQADIVTDRHVRGAPGLVVEILSPGTRQRDETLKRAVYARSGVREYWMVDPDAQTVVVCRATPAGTLDTVATLSAARSETLTSPMLPGFAIAVGELFARVHRPS